MKHPNRKVEAIRKEYALALISRKRMAAQSCFNWWLSKDYVPPKNPIPLTEDDLLNAIALIRSGGKTVSVNLRDL